ncbi:MAG: ATP-binding protein [Alphaproteobacteria bacterium]|nr:ATP-binding protein [Alphaproteobacteria bacterium]
MLVSFTVKNYRSFAESQTLSLVSGAGAKNNERFSFATSNTLAPNLLRSACVFGANASGKSSLVKAIDFFKNFVISSAKSTQEGEEIKAEPNLLVGDFKNQPSEFEVVFIHKESLYQYGFSVDKNRVWEEWLFSRPNAPKSRTRELFHRKFNQDNNQYKWEINNTYIKGKKEIWKQATRGNALFLSQAVQLNAEDLKAPFEWIQRHFHTIESPDHLSYGFTTKQCVEKGWKNRVLKLLQSVDIKICDLEIETKEVDLSDLPDEMPQHIKDALKMKNEKITAFNISSLHKNSEGDLVSLDINDESDGTNALFKLAGPLFDMLDDGDTLIVDELHNSLHPLALKALINLFHNPEINKNNAQLIFTSHETSIMAKDFIHKDQIWLAENNNDEGTQLIPLSDFDVRDVNNFQKAYLDGRYGGIPKIRGFINGE